jgi:hypothetical protein
MGRHSANGTEYFRAIVITSEGSEYSIHGPYSTRAAAKTEGKRNITSHSWGDRSTWTIKIQELKPIIKWVDIPGVLSTDPWNLEPTAHLEWIDVDG